MTIERTRKRFKGAATLLAAGFAVALLAPSHAAASGCSRDPGNAAATAAVIGAVRAACPCASFTTRTPHRRCVRAVIADAIGSGALAPGCRSDVMRFASGSTCGSKPGTVACCRTGASGRESCGLASSTARCESFRGGTGRVGSTESCYDACDMPPDSNADVDSDHDPDAESKPDAGAVDRPGPDSNPDGALL